MIYAATAIAASVTAKVFVNRNALCLAHPNWTLHVKIRSSSRHLGCSPWQALDTGFAPGGKLSLIQMRDKVARGALQGRLRDQTGRCDVPKRSINRYLPPSRPQCPRLHLV